MTSLRARLSARLARSLTVAGVATTTVVMAACSSDRLTGSASPAPAGDRAANVISAIQPLTTVKALLRDVPLATNQTRSWTVRRNQNTTLEWPEVGLKVSVPEGAFSAREMTISITALAGDVIAYDFGPDGSQFAKPLVVLQSLKGTSWYKADLGKVLRGAYFRSPTDVSDGTNTAKVAELLSTEVDISSAQVKFRVTHFSGYMVSMD